MSAQDCCKCKMLEKFVVWNWLILFKYILKSIFYTLMTACYLPFCRNMIYTLCSVLSLSLSISDLYIIIYMLLSFSLSFCSSTALCVYVCLTCLLLAVYKWMHLLYDFHCTEMDLLYHFVLELCIFVKTKTSN